jgi:hypothetical protein
MTSDREAPPLIALISATPSAIPPAAAGLAREFPEAQVWNILDDRLLSDAAASGQITPTLARRMRRLIGHALAEDASAVLLTCSMYGPVAHEYAGAATPVLAADDAAFADASGGEFTRLLVLASFDAALEDSVRRLSAASALAGRELEILGATVPAAFDGARRGDAAQVRAALRDACQGIGRQVDGIVLAQYSLAPASAGLADDLGVPVISGPESAGALLRSRLGTGRPTR